MNHKEEGGNLRPLSTYCIPGPVPCTLSSFSHLPSGIIITRVQMSKLGSEQEGHLSTTTRTPGVSASKTHALAPHRRAEASSSLPQHLPPLTSVRDLPAG